MNMTRTERGWRGTPDLWLDAAYDLLVEGGIEAVKVMPLAARLGLSRTSFYWHFPDRETLLSGLVDRWKAKNTGTLVARSELPAATIAEAMLTKTPVIASDIPPLVEASGDGEYAEIFKVQDADDLAEKILKFLDDKNLRVSLAEKAYSFARERYSIEAHLKKLKTLYENLLNE